MYLQGFGFGGFRSFREPQLLWPLAKVNLFVGQNNSGKSNVLLFLSRYLHAFLRSIQGHQAKWTLDAYLDTHQGSGTSEIRVLLARRPAREEIAQLASHLQAGELATAERLLGAPPLARETSLAWFEYVGAPGTKLTLATSILEQLIEDKTVSRAEWSSVWQALTHQTGGGVKEHWIPETLAKLSPVNYSYPEVVFIPAIRQVSPGEHRADSWSGQGLIVELAKLQNPLPHEHANRARFDRLNELLREVTGNEEAELEVPHDRSTLNVHMESKVLPLPSLGTGIHQVIILGAAATVHDKRIVCLEEPEIHLHPTLQRKLLRYLSENTENQYFIATHSAHLIDVPDASVFRVRLENGASVVTNAKAPNEKWEICAELGYRPSDLMQANCVIWVEGPSDRIIIRHWLASAAPELVEGIHYSIMFYGGRLLSHLSATDDEVSEFISLRKLNRRSVVVMDSDKNSAEDEINATKKRVCEEFNQPPGFAWVTHGKELENYFSSAAVLAAIRQIDSKATTLSSPGRFRTLWKYKRDDGTLREVDKVKLAHELANAPADLSADDLRGKVEALAAFVRDANGIRTSS